MKDITVNRYKVFKYTQSEASTHATEAESEHKKCTVYTTKHPNPTSYVVLKFIYCQKL